MRFVRRLALVCGLLVAGCSSSSSPSPSPSASPAERSLDRPAVCGVLALPHSTPEERLALIAETEKRLQNVRGLRPRDRIVNAAAVVLISTRTTEAIASLAPSSVEPEVAGAFDDALQRLEQACR